MRIGVVGVGRLGSFFARTLAEHPEVDRLLLAGSKPDSAIALADELGMEAVPSAAHVIDAADAVVIAASTSAHPEFIRRAAEAGIPAFCEKPIALDLATTDAVIDLVRSSGIELQVGFQRRFEPGYKAARDLVRSGRMGEIYTVRTVSHDPFPSPAEFIATSGDLFRDLVIHDFDAIRFVTGQEIIEVCAVAEAGFPHFEPYRSHGDAGIGAGVIRLSDGATAVFTAARHNPLGYDVRMEVFGSADSIAVGWDDRTPLRSMQPGARAPLGPAYRDFLDRFAAAYRTEIRAFVDLANGRIANPCPPEAARSAFVAALAAGRSVIEQRPVRLSEFD